MSIALAGRGQIERVLDEVMLGTRPTAIIRCDTPADAIKLRLRMNKVRQTNRRDSIRQQERDGVKKFEQRETSRWDDLTFQILPNSRDVIIHKQAETGDSIFDHMYFPEADGTLTPYSDSVEPISAEDADDTQALDL